MKLTLKLSLAILFACLLYGCSQSLFTSQSPTIILPTTEIPLSAARSSSTPVPEATATPQEVQIQEATQEPSATYTAVNMETSTPTGYISPTNTPTYTPTYAFPLDVDPLTGLAVEPASLLNRRPVMIKVSNYPPAIRPQSGLSLADWVFEYYIGEGLNRFVALYYSADSPSVGPIRSGRLVDAQLAEMFQSFLVYGGADERVDTVIIDIIGERAVSVLNEHPCPPICGEDTHSTEGVFASSGGISQYMNQLGRDNQRPVLNGFLFDPGIPAGAQAAANVGIQFSKLCRGEWHYDESSGEYLRWTEKNMDFTQMEPMIDRVTEKQLAFTNIVILFADYIIYTPTLHDIQLWQNIEGKRMLLFRDGVLVEGTWKTISDKQPFQLYDHSGLPMKLKPGTTWAVIVDTNSSIYESSAGTWEVMFKLP
jgi:hypothetical protein